MNNFQSQNYRIRALAAISRGLSNTDDDELDSIARIILKLPPKPFGAEPFKGWLLPQRVEEISIEPGGHTTSNRGIDLIKRWEGFRSKPYVCPGGVITIGYGHTKEARAYSYVTKRQAEAILRKDLRIYENHVNDLVSVDLTQNQFDALVSFAFNLGGSQLRSSSLLKHLNKGDYYTAAKWFPRYIYAGKRKLKGLILRRAEEKALFLKK